MSSTVSVRIHSSQFPGKVRQDLLESFRARQINHKFHYDSIKQTQKWLALHQAYSPSRTDEDCEATYEKSFSAAAKLISADRVHLIGLGCGGGRKDTRLLSLLKEQGKELFYTPSDVSVAMVLVAQETAASMIAAENCFPFVCDLAAPDDLREEFSIGPDEMCARLFTFFGMIPNFEPQTILPKLANLLRLDDLLLFSANLAPGSNYSVGLQKILPLYDNPLTRDWLESFLWNLGVEKGDGDLQFTIEDSLAAEVQLKRVTAHFVFTNARAIEFPEGRFEFHAGEKIRLFFSYRHTPELMGELLAAHGLAVLDQWITQSEEEGVFLCRKSH